MNSIPPRSTRPRWLPLAIGVSVITFVAKTELTTNASTTTTGQDGGVDSSSSTPVCPPDMSLVPAARAIKLGDDAIGRRYFPENRSHTTVIKQFCIDTYEVSLGRYHSVTGVAPTPGCDLGIDFPAVCVSILDAKAYCHSLGRRLPTSDEWEYAGRGVDGRLFPWGSLAPGGGVTLTIHRVGADARDRSPFKVFDLGQNAGEWVDDQDCTAPGSGVVRGTMPRAWADGALVHERCGQPSSTIGFRCAVDIP